VENRKNTVFHTYSFADVAAAAKLLPEIHTFSPHSSPSPAFSFFLFPPPFHLLFEKNKSKILKNIQIEFPQSLPLYLLLAAMYQRATHDARPTYKKGIYKSASHPNPTPYSPPFGNSSANGANGGFSRPPNTTGEKTTTPMKPVSPVYDNLSVI
jgi:hypothetical protein